MKQSYENIKNKSLLRTLNEAGIFPSPFNYSGRRRIKLDQYVIHDSTLREGEQTPNIILSLEDKLKIAQKLDEVGVRRLESGFPAASEKQFKTIKALVGLDLDAQIVAFARAKKEDINAAADTGAQGIIVSYSISSFHRESKFNNLTKEEYLRQLTDVISYAEGKGMLVFYSAEDTSRERDLVFLKKAYKTAVDAGAKRARVIDTLGCMSPSGITYLIKEIRKVVNVPLEVHLHNDMGLSLANSISAIEAGASAISTCVNGMGERVGVTATEEAIAALYILFGVDYFDIGKLTELSLLVEKICGIKMAANKPITGLNVLVHSSGIHQDGIMKNPITYEFYPQHLFGGKRKIELNELSGRRGIQLVVKEELGMEITEEKAKQVLSTIKDSFSCGRKTNYTIGELRSIIANTLEA